MEKQCFKTYTRCDPKVPEIVTLKSQYLRLTSRLLAVKFKVMKIVWKSAVVNESSTTCYLV